MRNFILTCLITLVFQTGFAQNWQKKLNKCLDKFDASQLSDSVGLYAFNLYVHVKHDKKTGKTTVQNIIMSDTLGYRFFPNYKNIETIDFKALASGKNVTIIMPILVFFSDELLHPYLSDTNNMVSVANAVKAIRNLEPPSSFLTNNKIHVEKGNLGLIENCEILRLDLYTVKLFKHHPDNKNQIIR